MNDSSHRGFTRRRFLQSVTGLAAAAALPWQSVSFAASLLRDRLDESALEAFRKRLTGRIILPSDPAYGSARRVASFNPTTDKRPGLIVFCADAADVARSVEFARKHALEIAVRGGGHDVLGQSVCEGGMLIDLEQMNRIAVDAAGRQIAAQAGVRAGVLDAALREHGVVAALGCNPAVGIAGLTLGGGLGWFLGKYGATCDNLLGADVVTVDGRILRTGDNDNSDLFWALKGGGGNFGIVTSFNYRVHAQPPVTGGYLAWSGERLGDFLRFYQIYMADVPDELTVEMFMFAPREPVMFVVACHSGEEKAARKALAPLVAFAKPQAGGILTAPYGAPPPEDIVNLMHSEGAAAAERPSADEQSYVYWKGAEVGSLNDEAIDTFVRCVAKAPPGFSVGIGHYMHGAACRPGKNDSALPRRCGNASIFFNTGWAGMASAAENMDWVDGSIAAMRPHSSKATYINYLSDGSPAAVRAAYGDRYARLAALKRRYDPDNVLHLNRNIVPGS